MNSLVVSYLGYCRDECERMRLSRRSNSGLALSSSLLIRFVILRGELDVHRRRYDEDGALTRKPRTAFMRFLDIRWGLCRTSDEIAHSGSLNLLGSYIVPEGVQSFVVK